MNRARNDILRSIREVSAATKTDVDLAYSRIPRNYQQAGTLTSAEKIGIFLDRLADYDAVTHRCGSDRVAATVAQVLRDRSKTQMLIPSDFSSDWLPAGFAFVSDRALSYNAIQAVNGFLTTCSAAIAITGTIILQEGAPGQGRRVLSLLPDYLLCLVEARQIAETVPEGMRAIEATSQFPITTISGPSATADIEMVRIRGVHGPRFLEVIVVED